MSQTLPSSEMLETPPGYPFEEIIYEDIDVEEVSSVLSKGPGGATAVLTGRSEN